MANKNPTAKVLNVTNEFDGFLKVNRYTIEADRHEGGKQTYDRLVMERGHAVGILAYDPVRDEVVLVNEMRPGILAAGEYPYTDALPAGGISKGETDIEAAVREMAEETGLIMKNLQVIHTGAYVSPGGTSEKISIVFGVVDASEAGGIHGNVDEDEDIKMTIMKSCDFITKVRSSEITDMKTVIAGYWLPHHLAALARTSAEDAAPAD